MNDRPPFVSGLPGDLAAAATALAGLDMLGRIRARARAEAETLAPLCAARFDGAERVEADARAVAMKEEFDAIVALVDGIHADRVMQLRAAAILTRKG